MIKDVNMQHMTMKEYVAVAILTELVGEDYVQKGIINNKTTPKEVVHQSFYWAELFMKVREERNAKT